MDLDSVKLLKRKYGDSFYVFDVDKLRENHSRMYSAFNRRYENFIIAYSYKTNYTPALIKEMSQLGAYAEVVSRLEYDLALKIGEKPERIVFNGPIKTYDDIVVALEGESILNLDSFYEIDLVRRYVEENPENNYKIGLRVNFDLTRDGENPLQDGYKVSRFGFCLENGNLEKAIIELKKTSNIRVVGLHGHFSTSTRSLAVYQHITQTLCDIAKCYLADSLEYIDVGGGMYGHLPKEFQRQDTPSFQDYADVICLIMNKEKKHFKNIPLLIIEPGLSLVVDTFKFYCRVIDVKENQHAQFVLVDGSVHNIKPTMHSFNMPMKHLKVGNKMSQQGTFNIVGSTCMEKDYLALDYEGQIPERGDFFVFKNVGAYTIVFDPPFIKERPPIIAKDQQFFYLARRRERMTDFVNENIYIF